MSFDPQDVVKSTNQRSLANYGPEFALWAVVGIWASTFIAMKNAFDYIDPLAFMLLRFLLINVLAFGVLLVQWRRGSDVKLVIKREDLPQFVVTSLFGYSIYQLCSVLALDRSSVFTLSLLLALLPLMTMVLMAVRGEAVPPLGWLGLTISVVGVIVFLSDKRSGGDTILGGLLAIVAALAFAVYGLINRPLAASYPSSTYTAYSILIGTVPLLAVGGRGLWRQSWQGIPNHVWLGLAFVVIFPVYIAYQLWNFGFAKRGAATASSYALVVPVVSGVLSAIVFHEHFGPLKIAGAALVMGGLLVIRAKPDGTTSRALPLRLLRRKSIGEKA